MAFACKPTDASFLATAPKRFEDSWEIPLPAAAVWADLTSDTPLHWCRALTKITWTSARPFGVGTTRTAKVLGLIALQEEFIVWEEGRRKAFVGTAGGYKGATDSVTYVATPIRPGVFMVYWHEPKLGANVVHVQDFEKGVVHTNIALPDGTFQHMSGTIRILGER